MLLEVDQPTWVGGVVVTDRRSLRSILFHHINITQCPRTGPTCDAIVACLAVRSPWFGDGATFSKYIIIQCAHLFVATLFGLDLPWFPCGSLVTRNMKSLHTTVGLDRPPSFLNLCYFTFLTVLVKLPAMGPCLQCCPLFLWISVCNRLDLVNFCLYLVLLICIWLYFFKLLVWVRVTRVAFCSCGFPKAILPAAAHCLLLTLSLN